VGIRAAAVTPTRLRTAGVATALAVAALIPSALTAAGQKTPPSAVAEQIRQGRDLYGRLCAHCHGFDMASPGTVVPDLRRFPHDQKARFVDTVTYGKDNRMPPWGDLLTPAQIDELWAYVKNRGKP
jgi:mono/diheme cytochrome c family protein